MRGAHYGVPPKNDFRFFDPSPCPCMVNSSSFRNPSLHGLIEGLRSREEAIALPCGNDHLGEIFPSDLRCEELVHHAARPLITRITWTEVGRRSLVASSSLNLLLTHEEPAT